MATEAFPGAIALLGLIQGPFLHSWAVAVGLDQSFLRKSGAAKSNGIWRAGFKQERMWRQVSVSIVLALVYWGMVNTLGLGLVLVAHLAMVSLTVMLMLTDFDHFRIPNRLLYPGGTLSALLLVIAALIEDRSAALQPAFIGAVGYFTLLLVVYLAARGEGFGFGDVKLALLLGFFASFHSFRVLAYALLLTSLLGGIPAVILLALGKSRKTAIPYGPPLIVGTWAAIIWAPYLLT